MTLKLDNTAAPLTPLDLLNTTDEIEINTKRFTVAIVSGRARGWFEHHIHGDERGGGLWFEDQAGKLTLTDYDGVACLPKQVWEALEQIGVVIGEEFK